MSLLERIAVLREQHGGISINKLEKEAGITRGSIAKWDDHTPSYDKVKKVADYFGVTVEYLLHGDDSVYQLAKATARQNEFAALSEADQIQALDYIKRKALTVSGESARSEVRQNLYSFVDSLTDEQAERFLAIALAAFG